MWVHRRSLLISITFALPFLFGNALVALQSQIFLSFLRPIGQTTSHEQLLVLILIALVGVGGFVALFPILKKRRLYVVNAVVAMAFLAFAIFGVYALGKDFYNCSILKIPNCD